MTSPGRTAAALITVGALLAALLTACTGEHGADPAAAVSTRRPAAAGLPACTLVSADAVARETGFGVAGAVPGVDGLRSTCTYPASGAGPALALGVAPRTRFDDRLAAARRDAGVPGTDVPGLGTRACFLFGTGPIPSGLGTLVVQGETVTLDVTVRGLSDPARARETAVAVAHTALRDG